MDGVEDPLEKPSSVPSRIAASEPAAADQEHPVLEHVEREHRAPLVARGEREEDVAIANVVRPIVRATALS